MSSKNKALFIDIDGTVIEDTGYVSKPQDLKLLPGIIEALIKAQKRGFFLVFHSNKGGAFQKKGLTNSGLKTLDAAFQKMLTEEGVDREKIFTYYCTHYPDKRKRVQCTCRKPKTGLFDKAIRELHLDVKASFVIGDKVSDLIAGFKVSLQKALLVKRNGVYFDLKESEKKIRFDRCDNLSEAVEFILEKDNSYFF